MKRSDFRGEMRRKKEERELAERLLSGDVPESTPKSLADVARALDQLRAAPDVDPARAAATIAAMSDVISGSAPARKPVPMRARRFSLGPRLAAVALGAALIGSTSLAFTGSLPGPAQNAAHDVLSKIGVNVPRAHHNETPDTHPSNKGGEVSGVAHSTSPDGGKGSVVSNDASSGKSHAGEDHGRNGAGNSGDVKKNDHGIEGSPSPTPSPTATDGSGHDGGSGGSGDVRPSPSETPSSDGSGH